MKVKKVDVKKLYKLEKENNKLLKSILAGIREIEDALDVETEEAIESLNTPSLATEREEKGPISVITDYKNGKNNDSVTLVDTNWKEYLNLLTSSFKANEDGQVNIDIFLDCSGSTNEQTIRKFLLACKDMIAYCNVRVGCFDTKFNGFSTLKNEEDIMNLPLTRDGGTVFEAAVDAFDENVPNRIIFTDGYASMPEDSKGAYYIVYGEYNIEPKNAKVIYVAERIILNDNTIQSTR